MSTLSRVDDRRDSRFRRWGTVACLVVAGLFYLQFGLQALVHHLGQAILTLVGAVALGWGAARRVRGATASSVVFLGTLPILLLHVVLTIEDPGELPFLIGSIPVPVVAIVAMIVGRRD